LKMTGERKSYDCMFFRPAGRKNIQIELMRATDFSPRKASNL
jgi:hypothetical protein